MTDLVTIRTYDLPPMAELEAGILRDAGFFCFVDNAHTVAIHPLLSNAVGGVALQVPADQVDAAMAHLASVQMVPLEEEGEPESMAHDGASAVSPPVDDGNPYRPAVSMAARVATPRDCPACGSDCVSTFRPFLWVVFGAAFFLPVVGVWVGAWVGWVGIPVVLLVLPLLLVKQHRCARCGAAL